jgi:hypothetical protein
MLSLDPPFKVIIYPPTLAAFGGVEISPEGPYNLQKLKNEVTGIIRSMGDSLRSAYEVKTIIEQPRTNLLSTRVTPIEADLDKRSAVLDVGYVNLDSLKMIRNVLRRMAVEKKDNAIVMRDNGDGLYVFHELKDRFDPVSTGYLLENTKKVLIGLAGQKCNARSEITPNYLEVDVEVERPRFELSV